MLSHFRFFHNLTFYIKFDGLLIVFFGFVGSETNSLLLFMAEDSCVFD